MDGRMDRWIDDELEWKINKSFYDYVAEIFRMFNKIRCKHSFFVFSVLNDLFTYEATKEY